MTVSISGIPIELVEKIDELAATEDRTRSSFLRRLIERFVESQLANESKR